MKNYKTYLPIFPGFYNTLFEPDETYEIESINDQRRALNLPEIDYDDCEFDYDSYKNEVSEASCEFIENKLSEILNEEVNVKFEKLVSPRWYNYSNDSINIEITISLNKVYEYLCETIDEFEEYIYDKYTSRSGFISSYSNDHNVWLNEYLRDADKLEHCLGSVLNFIIENELGEYDSIEEMCGFVQERTIHVYATNYEELTNESNSSNINPDTN
jgi:hypothetical protein